MKIFLCIIITALTGIACSGKSDVAAPYTPVAKNGSLPRIETTNDARRDSVIAFASKYMGTKYCYASEDPVKGFDCSGFVHYVYKHFDVALPRSSSGFKDIGVAKKPADFKVGDILVFYGYQDSNSIGHLGIIVEANGMQSRFIHASSGSEMAVTVSELGSAGYTKRFYKCIDPFAL